MLQPQTQEAVLLILGSDLSYFSKFKNEGLSITKELFNPVNQKKLEGLEKAKSLGYTKLTAKFIEEYDLDYRLLPINKDDFLDVVLDVRKQVTEQNKQKAKTLIGQAFKKYEKSTEDNELEAIKNLQHATLTIQTVQIKDNTYTADEVVEQGMVYKVGKEMIPTYLDELDNKILLGGYERSAIHVIGGFPGNGKTTAAVQFGTLQAMHGYKVLFFSLEQSKENIISNMLSVASEKTEHNRSYWNISKLTKETADQKKKEAKDIISERVQEKFQVNDTHWSKQEDFIERVRRACLVENYDVVIIDNFQNAPRLIGNYSDEKSYTAIADALLAIAKLSNTAIIALSQLTMDHGKETTKYSKRLNEHASTNIKIERILKDEDNIDDIDKVKLFSIKARGGEQNKELIFHFTGAKSIIGSFTMPEIDNEKKMQYKIRRSEKETGYPF